MTCDKMGQDLLSSYLDGEMASPDRALVEAHLKGCPACRQRVEEAQFFDRILSHGRDPQVPFEVWERVRARIERPSFWEGALAWVQGGPQPARVMALIVVLVLGLSVGQKTGLYPQIKGLEGDQDIVSYVEQQESLLFGAVLGVSSEEIFFPNGNFWDGMSV